MREPSRATTTEDTERDATDPGNRGQRERDRVAGLTPIAISRASMTAQSAIASRIITRWTNTRLVWARSCVLVEPLLGHDAPESSPSVRKLCGRRRSP
jgi:hypothetical protein